MFRKHTLLIIILIFTCLIIYYLDFNNILEFNLSLYPLAVSLLGSLILIKFKKIKDQIFVTKWTFYLNTIFILKYIIFDIHVSYGFIYLAFVTLILALSYKSLKKDQDIIDSMDRLR
tara:strand:- start:376 stop:726 length:351 start_codon:yes stop_codon:yes gene_type:complete